MTERVFKNKLFQKTIGKILTIKTRESLLIEDLKNTKKAALKPLFYVPTIVVKLLLNSISF